MNTAQGFPKISLELEEMLQKQIFKALQGDVISNIIKIAKVEKEENYWRFMLEGHSFKVEENMLPRLHKIFNEVKEKLNFKEKVDFYITNDSDVNAFALSSFEEDEPHIININSALLKLMTDDELKFIIGHEIGHLINKNADLLKLINFVFPNSNTIPDILMYKIRLWKQLSELSADRYGFIACSNLEVCISAFFKMSSGLDTKLMQINTKAFLLENDKRLEYFKESGLNLASHPINPIRVKAVDLFSRSIYFKNDSEALSVDDLDEEMENLMEVLLKIKSSELDYLFSCFIAVAGFFIAKLDEEVHDNEMEVLLDNLSNYVIFPRNFLLVILESNKLEEYFVVIIEKILEINPATREQMIVFMINMILADKRIKDVELEFVFSVGKDFLGYSEKEIAQIFADVVKRTYMPALEDLV